MRRRLLVFLVLVAVFASVSVTSRGQQGLPMAGLRLYDSFDQGLINPAKWFSQYQCGSGPVMECEREIRDGQLHLRARTYGANDANGGNQYGNSSLFLTASSVTDIVAEVTIQETSAQGCSTIGGLGGTHGQALLTGAFFNGGGGTANDDVKAFLQFDRYSTDSPGMVLVGGFLQYQGQFFGNVNIGLINVGERVFVELKWDKANHRFVERLFRPSNNTFAEQDLTYSGISDSIPAVAPSKQLSASAFADNCTSNQTFADMGVNFGRILSN